MPLGYPSGYVHQKVRNVLWERGFQTDTENGEVTHPTDIGVTRSPTEGVMKPSGGLWRDGRATVREEAGVQWKLRRLNVQIKG